jgi:hypothetical protein
MKKITEVDRAKASTAFTDEELFTRFISKLGKDTLSIGLRGGHTRWSG